MIRIYIHLPTHASAFVHVCGFDCPLVAGHATPPPTNSGAEMALRRAAVELDQKRGGPRAVAEHHDALSAPRDGDVQDPTLLLDVLRQSVGHEPVVVKDHAGTAHHAINGAVGKLKRAVTTVIEKHDPRHNTALSAAAQAEEAPTAAQSAPQP